MKNELSNIPKQKDLFQVPEGYWESLPGKIAERESSIQPQGLKISLRWIIGIAGSAAACIIVAVWMIPGSQLNSTGELAGSKRNFTGVMTIPSRNIAVLSNPVENKGGIEIPVQWDEMLEDEELEYVEELAVLLDVVPVPNESLMDDMWSEETDDFEMFTEI